VRRKTVALLCLLGLFLGGLVRPAGAAQQRELLLNLTKVDVKYDRRAQKATITVAGTTKNFPAGTKIRLKLLYNFFEVGRCIVTVKPDASVGPAVIKPTCPLPPDTTYEIDMEIHVDDQEPRMQKQIEKFLASVRYKPFVRNLTIGTPEDKKKAEAEVKKFIKSLLARAVALNNEFITEVEAAEQKLKYQTAGGLDTKAWRAFVDNNWRPRMIKLQKEFAAWLKKYPAYRYRYGAGVLHLEDMLRTIAWRSVYRSRKLYALFKKKPSLEDLSPPQQLKIRPAYGRVSNDKAALRYLGRCYKIVREAFGLVPPPEQKKAPAEKKKESGKSGGGGTKKKGAKKKSA